MKTSCKKIYKVFLSLFFAGCFLFLNASCGLDEYFVLDNPKPIPEHQPSVTPDIQNEFQENYVTFLTQENEMTDWINNPASNFTFEGTEVYYKIYNNYQKFSSETGSLNSISSSENYSSAGTKLLDYGFLPLACENYDESPIVPATGTNRLVKIRLTDYQTENEYSSRIELAGVSISGDGKSSQPRRNGIVGNYSFNFGRASDNQDLNKVPSQNDADCNYSSSDKNFFYVPLYAVAVGRDSNYTTYYSNILYLGTITIDADSRDN